MNLLARQFGVVREILLDVPDCGLLPGVIRSPRIDNGDLRKALIGLGKAVGGDLTRTRVADATRPTVALYVGDGLNPADSTVPAIAVSGNGWRTHASTLVLSTQGAAMSSNPLGPYLAACIAAGYAFKSAFGKQTPVDRDFDLWRVGAVDGPQLEGVALPTAYVLGLGAVGAAFGHTLAAAPGIRGQVIGVDPQTMSDTDANRLISGTSGDVGERKVDLFARLFQGTDIEPFTTRGRWPAEYLADRARVVPAAIRAEERALRFAWVISCVDRDRDRVEIARALPRHVLSGSTYEMAAQTAYYSVEGACECLGCRHRTPRQLGVEKLADELRSLGTAERKAWYERYGATEAQRASIEEFLSDPTCAGPGGADLARLELNGAVDWAVGFVSVAAGVLLAARFIRAALLGPIVESTEGSEWRYFSWRDELHVSRAQRARDCPVCHALRDEWQGLWSSGQSLSQLP